MSIPLHTASTGAPRTWFLFKAQAVAHAVLGLVVGVGSLVAGAHVRGQPALLTLALGALLLAWIAGLVALRRKSARLRTEFPIPPRRRHALLLAAFPLLQLAGIVPTALLQDPEAGYVVLALTGIALFVLVLLSGICFAVAEVPIQWDGWMITLGTSLLAGAFLGWEAISNFRIF